MGTGIATSMGFRFVVVTLAGVVSLGGRAASGEGFTTGNASIGTTYMGSVYKVTSPMWWR